MLSPPWIWTPTRRGALALAVFVVFGAPGSGGAQDVEPNDSFEEARPVSCGAIVPGTIGPGDPSDFFWLTNIPPNTILRLEVNTPGTCLLGTTPDAPCTEFNECGQDGLCEKALDTLIVGYAEDRSELFVLDDTFTGDPDPIGTVPVRNTAPAQIFLQIGALPNGTVEPYTLSIGCTQPTSLSCPVSLYGLPLFKLESEGDMDVFAVSVTSVPRKLSFNIDAEELFFNDVQISYLDSLIRLYGPDWSLIAESQDNLAPNEPCLLCAESVTDSYIRAHVFQPGTYYVAVTCGDDFDFIGCPDGPIDPLFEDFEYRLQRQCQNANATPLACTPSGTFVSDELDPLPFTNPGVEVDFYNLQVSDGDRIQVDIDSNPATSMLHSVVGLFEPVGHFLDGMPLLLEDEPTCDFETDACNDDGIAPDDNGAESLDDSYLAFCAPHGGEVVLGISNEGDFDFNGLDDFDNMDESYLLTQVGPYDLTVRCDRPDSDTDGATDCLDNCPALSNPGQEDRDGDGVGDACDPDRDGDGRANGLDNCPDVSNLDQLDTDSNGIGDPCQCGDVNGDGLTNTVDALRIARGEVGSGDPNFGKCDANGDGACNVTDALLIARGEVGSFAAAQLCPAYRGGG